MGQEVTAMPSEYAAVSVEDNFVGTVSAGDPSEVDGALRLW